MSRSRPRAASVACGHGTTDLARARGRGSSGDKHRGRMDVAIAGGHGQVALRVLRLLAERGDRARGLIRNPDHRGDLEDAGAELIDAAKANGIRRYVIVSSMGADDPASATGSMAPYLQAKAAADEALTTSGLDYTIIRPGMLTNDPGTGRIEAAQRLGRQGRISRDDVAATLVAVLGGPPPVGK